jgi:hypothetical protein
LFLCFSQVGADAVLLMAEMLHVFVQGKFKRLIVAVMYMEINGGFYTG